MDCLDTPAPPADHAVVALGMTGHRHRFESAEYSDGKGKDFRIDLLFYHLHLRCCEG